jgi:hypothetical protein
MGKQNSKIKSPKQALQLAKPAEFPCRTKINPDAIKGSDDAGRFYNSHAELLAVQALHKSAYYRANEIYWTNDGGYYGSSDDQAMVGDDGAVQDAEEGLAFLDRYLDLLQARSRENPTGKHQQLRFETAVDLGAGVGRVTKLILLKRYDRVRLVEGDAGWSKRSRTYLGKKRTLRCQFVHKRIDALTEADIESWGEPADLMWVQWTLQYLIDVDFVDCLRIMAGGLRPGTGILIVKENRPYGLAREDRFQMDLPEGENERYDITRPDIHHRLLFDMAGLKVNYVEQGEETNTYALSVG